MSALHTPGPWAVKHHGNDSYTIHVAGKPWETWAVAHVNDCVQDAANARLIAAAPDLLDLVIRMRDKQAALRNGGLPRDEAFEDEANAILDKVKGAQA